MHVKYSPQNNSRTNTFNYNIDASCVERILKTNLKTKPIFLTSLTPYCQVKQQKENDRKCF